MTNLEFLSTRVGFNSVMKQVRTTISIVEQIESNPIKQYAFELRNQCAQLAQDNFLTLVSLITEKFSYHSLSFNIGLDHCSLTTIKDIYKIVKNVDLIICYHNPTEGISIICDDEQKLEIKKNRLIVLYARALNTETDVTKLLNLIKEVILNKIPFSKNDFLSYNTLGNLKSNISNPVPEVVVPNTINKPLTQVVTPKPIQEPVLKESKKEPINEPIANEEITEPSEAIVNANKISPSYGVQVTNELFHNGNVEAWKNIIESYNFKYPSLEVLVYHKSERILNLNSLFKWGKVKHGEAIEFKVRGDFKDLAKLKRYLYEGASNRFEKFLQKEINSLLKLF